MRETNLYILLIGKVMGRDDLGNECIILRLKCHKLKNEQFIKLKKSMVGATYGSKLWE